MGRVLTTFRISAILVSLLCAGGGVATADPVSLPNVTVPVNTPDGYQLSATLADMSINSVPNMAATTFSREAYLSGTAIATISGGNVPVPVRGGKLQLSLMMGCQIDLNGGGYLGLETPLSVNTLTNILSPLTSILANPSAGVTPQGSIALQPGTISYQKLNDKMIEPDELADVRKDIAESGQASIRISVHDAHIKADGCGGPVSVRLIATAQMSTKNSDDESNAYGGIVSI